MWESEEETVRVVFSPQFLLQLQKRLSLYRPLHVSTSSISADSLEREPTPSPEFFCNENFNITNMVDLQAFDTQD